MGRLNAVLSAFHSKHTTPRRQKRSRKSAVRLAQARYQTSDSIRVSGVDLRSAADVDGPFAELRPVGGCEYLRVVFRLQRSSVKIDVKSDIELLNVSSPRNIYQGGCGENALGDEGCEKFTVDGRVTANSQTGSELITHPTHSGLVFAV